jgi:capsular polysaccharide biosynthesis protein
MIFISRVGQPVKRSRRLLNHEEIAETAARHGFEIVCCEKLPLAEQVKLFSEAAVIAGGSPTWFLRRPIPGSSR